MEYLLRPFSYVTPIGYPSFLFYIVAVIGLVLLVIRPYWALLFTIFCLAARNYHAAVFTRTALFGAYLNLNDLLLWISIFAMLIDILARKRQMWIPCILLLVFGVIIIGDFQSLVKYGFAENVLRRIRSTASFPIAFLIFANMIYDERRAKSLYSTLFVGATIAALQHIVYIYLQFYTSSFQFRTMSYIYSGGDALLLGAMFGKVDRKPGHLKNLLYYTSLMFIAISYIVTFTRTVLISICFASIFLAFLIRKRLSLAHFSIKFWLILGGATLGSLMLFVNFGFDNIARERLQYLTGYKSFLEASQDRRSGANAEIDIWLNGSLVLGTGCSLPLELDIVGARSADTGVALGHVGYTTYLAHYGLLGFIVYAILLPISTLKVGRRYYLRHATDYGGRLVLIGLARVLIDIIQSAASNHYLHATSHMPGVLYGVVWGLKKKRRKGSVKMFHPQWETTP